MASRGPVAGRVFKVIRARLVLVEHRARKERLDQEARLVTMETTARRVFQGSEATSGRGEHRREGRLETGGFKVRPGSPVPREHKALEASLAPRAIRECAGARAWLDGGAKRARMLYG